jgi:hypothetical protein
MRHLMQPDPECHLTFGQQAALAANAVALGLLIVITVAVMAGQA